MGVFASLESLNSVNEVDDDFDFVETLLDVDSSDVSLEESNSELTSILADDSATFEALDLLENTGKVIKEYGICKPFVELVDPEGYLQERQILPSAESLNDVPTKDENATVALEGIKEILKKAWDAIVKFFNAVVDWVKKLYTNVIASTKTKEKMITYIGKKLDEVKEIDSKKLKEKKVKVFSSEYASAFDTLGGKFDDKTKNIGSLVADMIKVDKAKDVVDEAKYKEFVKKCLTALGKFVTGIQNADVGTNESYKLSDDASLLTGFAKVDVAFSKTSLSLSLSEKKKGDATVEKPLTDVKVTTPGEAKDKLKVATNLMKGKTMVESYGKIMATDLDKIKKVATIAEKSEDKDAKYQLRAVQAAKTIVNFKTKLLNAYIKYMNMAVNMEIGAAKALLLCAK